MKILKNQMTCSVEVSKIYNLVLTIGSLNKSSFHKIKNLKAIAIEGSNSEEYLQAVNRIIEIAKQASKCRNYKRSMLALANTNCWADRAIQSTIE
jgi:hypothetical protein